METHCSAAHLFQEIFNPNPSVGRDELELSFSLSYSLNFNTFPPKAGKSVSIQLSG